MWSPWETLANVLGEAQAVKGAVSSLQPKSLPLSLAVNEKLGEVSLLGSLGFSAIAVVGATVSTLHAYVASSPALPA